METIKYLPNQLKIQLARVNSLISEKTSNKLITKSEMNESVKPFKKWFM